MKQSLFQRYGGIERVSTLVFAFYDRALVSERLAPFFAGCDMRRLIEHQTKYISSVMGGPASYTEAQLRELHAHLGIGNADFDEMIRLLGAAMAAQGFEADDIEAVLHRLGSLRRQIVTV